MQDIGVVTDPFGDIPEWMHIDGGEKTIAIAMLTISDVSARVLFDTI